MSIAIPRLRLAFRYASCRKTSILLPIAIALLAACAPRDDGEPRRATDDDTAAWRLADPPRVVIGGASAGPGYELHKVYGALLTSDGSIVIGNSGTGELRIFTPRGVARSVSGRQGSGPGEYRSINWLGPWRGDSILAYDLRLHRFSVVDAGGRFGRSFQFQASASSVTTQGAFPDASILLAQQTPFDPRLQAGTVRDTLVLVRITPAGEVMDTVARLPGAEWLAYEHTASFRATQLRFGHAGHVALTGNEIVYASSHSSELSVFDTTGALVRKIHVRATPRRLSGDEEAAFVDEMVSDPAEAAAIRRRLEAAGPRTAPLIGDLRVSRDGNLWVQLFPSAGSDSAKWVVMAPDGRALGSVRTSADALPLDIYPNILLIREHDADGVERVALRRILR